MVVAGAILFVCFFAYQQISSIIESETTLRIISHTKLNISYLLFLLSVVFLAFGVHNSLRAKKVLFCLWGVVGVQTILYYLSFNLTGVGFNESIPFHIKSGVKGAGIGDFYQLIIAFFFLVLLFIISGVFYFKKIIKVEHSHNKIKSNYFIVPMLVGILFFNPLNYDLRETYKVVEEKPEFLFKDFYHNPKTSLKSDKKYNLVWIYAEAFERIYLNQEIFPDLAPNLAQIEKESLSFSNIHQVWGTGWTIAGIVGSQCGVPLYAVGRQNNDLSQLPTFLPKIKGIGNILKEDGYENIFVQGSAKSFAGNDKFIESHGYKMYSFENIDAQYKYKKDISRWGLNDDKTLDFTKSKFQELEKTGKPFSLMVSTINTHSPRGFIPPAFRNKKYKDGKNITLNAFYVSDMLIAKFIREIRALDKDKNTIIVVSSDHLTMRNMVSNVLEQYPDKRRNLFMIYLPEKIKPQIINKDASTLDQGVTILDLMGYPIDKMGLGVSLISSEKSLKYKAKEETDDVLKSWKKYYFQFWE